MTTAPASFAVANSPSGERVKVAGRSVHHQSWGSVKPGHPTLWLENGWFGQLLGWGALPELLCQDGWCVRAYDRGNYGWSHGRRIAPHRRPRRSRPIARSRYRGLHRTRYTSMFQGALSAPVARKRRSLAHLCGGDGGPKAEQRAGMRPTFARFPATHRAHCRPPAPRSSLIPTSARWRPVGGCRKRRRLPVTIVMFRPGTSSTAMRRKQSWQRCVKCERPSRCRHMERVAQKGAML